MVGDFYQLLVVANVSAVKVKANLAQAVVVVAIIIVRVVNVKRKLL